MSEGPPQPPPPPPPSAGAPRGPMPQPPRVISGGRGPWVAVALILGVAAIIVLLVMGGILAAVMLPAFSRSREAARRASCQNNLKQFGLIFKMHAGENQGEYPPMAEMPGAFLFDKAALYPEYWIDPSILLCPSDDETPAYDPEPDVDEILADPSYIYLGYAIHAASDAQTEQVARAYIEACREHAARGAPLRGPLTVTTGAGATVTLEPLREMMDVPPHEVPVMFDRSQYHHDYGINVLYLDGHVEFLSMGSRFPALWWFLEELDAIEAQYAQ